METASDTRQRHELSKIPMSFSLSRAALAEFPKNVVCVCVCTSVGLIKSDRRQLFIGRDEHQD